MMYEISPSLKSSSSEAATAGLDHHNAGNNTDANNGDALFNQNWLPRIFFEISNSCPIGTRKATTGTPALQIDARQTEQLP